MIAEGSKSPAKRLTRAQTRPDKAPLTRKATRSNISLRKHAKQSKSEIEGLEELFEGEKPTWKKRALKFMKLGLLSQRSTIGKEIEAIDREMAKLEDDSESNVRSSLSFGHFELEKLIPPKVTGTFSEFSSTLDELMYPYSEREG